MTLAGVSLIAAIPGLVVVGLMVSAFLNYAGQASNMLLAVVGITMLTAAALALMPVGIIVFSGKAGKASKKAAPATTHEIPATAITGAITGEMAATGEFIASDDMETIGDFETSSEFEMTTGEFESSDFEDSEILEIEEDEDR